MMTSTVIVTENDADFDEKFTEYFTLILRKRIEEKKSEHNQYVIIGVSGGSVSTLLVPIFRSFDKFLLSKLRIFMVDERLVPISDCQSNIGEYLRDLPSEFHGNFVQFELNDSSTICAANYRQKILTLNPEMTIDNVPKIDILLLGLGPDGHTCSLFPGHPSLQNESYWLIPVENSPKPPSRRITVTLPLINNAFYVVFLVRGRSKAPVIKKIIQIGSTIFPGGLVNPLSGNLHWFLDQNSASLLQ